MVAIAFAMAVLQMAQDRMPALIDLAKSAVRAEVLGKSTPKPTTKTETKAVFVTIEKAGKVLGCRGSLEPRTSSAEEDVILAARGAAAHDPRYRPLTKSDLDGFQVTVTLVNRLEPISTVDGLQPADGLVLEAGNKKGIVLPWEGKDPKVRLKWACQKAGVADSQPRKLFRLIAIRSRG